MTTSETQMLARVARELSALKEMSDAVQHGLSDLIAEGAGTNPETHGALQRIDLLSQSLDCLSGVVSVLANGGSNGSVDADAAVIDVYLHDLRGRLLGMETMSKEVSASDNDDVTLF